MHRSGFCPGMVRAFASCPGLLPCGSGTLCTNTPADVNSSKNMRCTTVLRGVLPSPTRDTSTLLGVNPTKLNVPLGVAVEEPVAV